MNDTLFPELNSLKIEISDEVRDEQFAAIVAAIEAVPAASPSLVERTRVTWRRWAAATAALTTALVPVAAVASESAVPGDLLYPIKLTVERVQLIFDSDIDAEHRVNELETLVAEESDVDVVEAHIAETLDAVEDATDRDDLTDRVADAIARYRDTHREVDSPTEPTTDDRRDVDDSDRTTTTTEPVRDGASDRTTTTTKVDGDDAARDTTTTTRGADQSPTTTSPASDGEGGGGDDVPPGDGDRGRDG